MSQDNDRTDEIPEQTSAPGRARGKCYDRYMEGSNVVLRRPDVAESVHDQETANEALRQYLAEHGSPPSKQAGYPTGRAGQSMFGHYSIFDAGCALRWPLTLNRHAQHVS